MRVLLVHNYYGSGAPSGENDVFELEQGLLRKHGHEVATFVRRSDEIRDRGLVRLVAGGLATPWNVFTPRRVQRAVREFRPDVVHVHNTFPLISPAVFSAVGPAAARVLTMHNYRLLCPAAIPLRDGRPCTECIDQRSVLPALRYGCYRGSRSATLPLAASVALHRRLGTWTRQVDAFIALTGFQRELMVKGGLPAERVHVKPNFHPVDPRVAPWPGRADRVVFAGRLSIEKGLETLVDAWLAWGDTAPELRLLGDGPLRGELQRRARGARITFLGQVAPAVVEAELAAARLAVLPSLWFEGFPMVLVQAFALGTPAAVSDLGPLPGIVNGRAGVAGVVFRAGDPAALLREVRAAWREPERLRVMGERARAEFEARYSADSSHAALLEIYRRAVAVQAESAGRSAAGGHLPR